MFSPLNGPLSTAGSYTIKPAITEKYFGVANNTDKKIVLTKVSTNISSGITFPDWKPITISPGAFEYFEVLFEYESILESAETGAWYRIHIQYLVDGLNKMKSIDIPLNMDLLPTPYEISFTAKDDFQEKKELFESEFTKSKMANDDQKVRVKIPILAAFFVILAAIIIMDVLFFY